MGRHSQRPNMLDPETGVAGGCEPPSMSAKS